MPDHVLDRPSFDELWIGGDDARPALVHRGRTISYRELRRLVGESAEALALPERSVVLLHGRSSIEFVVSYLAVHAAGHVALLAGDHVERLEDAWRPAAVVHAAPSVSEIRRTGTAAPVLHPELALLLSTSGSTGSPKLVRLSQRNLLANARSIREYLGLTPADRGITSLPLHYCYGLSVLHAHLAAGASIVLSDASVVDPCFRRELHDHGVTNLAGVPHTFDLIERADPDLIRTPTMRLLTVAGGRMAPADVVRWAERCDGWGAELYVMYGQTEATARMAYLPPSLARRCPDAVGVPIPGGELRVDAPAGEIGELVYRGDNVMLGYAESQEDLALGATLEELRTGDLGRFDERHGVFHVVGRRSRFVKPFGVRIDLDRLETDLRGELGLREVAVAGDDDLVAVVAPGADGASVQRWVVERTKLPGAHVQVVTHRPIPRTERGKADTPEILARARLDATRAAAIDTDATTVAGVMGSILGRRDVTPEDTFVSLGGDSLAYVECSIRLERLVRRLPTDWHLVPVRRLEDLREVAAARPDGRTRRLVARIDTTVPLRAIAICTIVGTHMRVFFVPGGAHLLLAIVGYNLSRFLLPVEGTRERVRAGIRALVRTAGPVVAWVATGMLAFGAYSVPTLLLVNNYVGPGDHTRDLWDFWFIEVLVHLTLIVLAAMSVPAIRRAERRRPYLVALSFLAVTLVFRYRIIEILDLGDLRFRTHGAAFFFALGWLVHRSRTMPQRIATTAITATVVSGFFGLPERELYIIGGLVLLVWSREVVLPAILVPIVGLVSSASLAILITHFTVWPRLIDLVGRNAAYPLTIATGVAAWALVRVATSSWRTLSRRADDRRSRPRLAELA